MKKIKPVNLLFFVAYFMYIYSIYAVRVNFTKQLIELFKLLIPIFLGLVCIMQGRKYSLKTILSICALIIISLVSNIYTKSSSYLYLIGFIVACKDIEKDNIIKYDIKIKIFILLYVITCCFFGLADNVICGRADGTIRYSLGFNHPNTIGMCLLSISCGIMYLKYESKNISKFLFPVLAFICSLYICDSRSSQIGIIILIILSIILPKIKNNKLVTRLLPYTHIILFILSFIMTILYSNGNTVARTLDNVFNTRIYWMARFYNHYNLNMFGNYFSEYGIRGYDSLGVLDNAYMHLIIRYGIILTTILFISMIIYLKKAVKLKHMNVFVYILPILVYGLMEKNIFEPSVNAIMIFLNSLLYVKKEKK